MEEVIIKLDEASVVQIILKQLMRLLSLTTLYKLGWHSQFLPEYVLCFEFVSSGHLLSFSCKYDCTTIFQPSAIFKKKVSDFHSFLYITYIYIFPFFVDIPGKKYEMSQN